MFILGNFLIALAKIISIILTFYYWLILIRALIRWINPDPFNPIVQFLYRATEPVLEPIRRIIPPFSIANGSLLDISVIVAFLIIVFLQNFLVASLLNLGWSLR